MFLIKQVELLWKFLSVLYYFILPYDRIYCRSFNNLTSSKDDKRIDTRLYRAKSILPRKSNFWYHLFYDIFPLGAPIIDSISINRESVF